MSFVINKIRAKLIAKMIVVCDGNVENAKIIDQSVYDFTMHTVKKDPRAKFLFRELYINKMRQLYLYFKKDSYLNLSKHSEKVMQDPEKLKNIAFIGYKDLCPEKWALLEEDMAILDDQMMQNNKNVQTSDLFTCPKCKGKNCTFTEVQTRSCDESATIFVDCVDCGNSFRG